MKDRLTTVVIPVAGLGTRFLPITKTVPKELLPIVTQPTLQYGVEEAYHAGIRRFIFVTSPDKPSPVDYFLPNTQYQRSLELRGKSEALAELNRLIADIEIICVTQSQPLGLGHAVLMAQQEVGASPFAVLLPDVIIDSSAHPINCTQQLRIAFETVGCAVNATEKISDEEIHLYGVYDIETSEGSLHWARGVVEKPSLEEAPSRFAVVGRYIFTPEIFSILAKTTPGRRGEIQLADAMNTLAKRRKLVAAEFEGRHFDTGDPVGFLKANIYFGAKIFGKDRILP